MDVHSLLKTSLTLHIHKLSHLLSPTNNNININTSQGNTPTNNNILILPFINDIEKKENNKGGEYQQYSFLYKARYNDCIEQLRKQATNKWKNIKLCKNILDIDEQSEQIIIGITYKDMPLRPTILQDIQINLGKNKPLHIVDEHKDNLSLEDLSGRIRINKEASSIDINKLVTGIPLCFLGRIDPFGLFIVKDYEYYQAENLYQSNLMDTTETDSYILFVSNLSFNHKDDSDLVLARNFLLEFIQGKNMIPGSKLENISKNLQRVIIAGNSINSPNEIDEIEVGSYLKDELNKRVYSCLLNNYAEFEEYLYKISACIPVDVLPGEEDNSSSFIPDKGISPLMFPSLTPLLQNHLVNLVSNPYQVEINGQYFLGTSGNNIRSIRQCTTISDDLTAMESSLEWGHIVPNAPDFLSEFPYLKHDPLIIKTLPDVYFSGCSESFRSGKKEINGKLVNIFTIPKFSETYSVVVLNLNGYKFEQINFKNDIIKLTK